MSIIERVFRKKVIGYLWKNGAKKMIMDFSEPFKKILYFTKKCGKKI